MWAPPGRPEDGGEHPQRDEHAGSSPEGVRRRFLPEDAHQVHESTGRSGKDGHLWDTGPGLPWLSRGSDSILPMQRARVQSLVRGLRPHMPHCVAKR